MATKLYWRAGGVTKSHPLFGTKVTTPSLNIRDTTTKYVPLDPTAPVASGYMGLRSGGSSYYILNNVATNFGTVATESDWTNTTGVSGIYKTKYNGGYWISVGSYYNGTLYSAYYSISTDNGANWSTITQVPAWQSHASQGSARCIEYGNGVWILAGDSRSGTTITGRYSRSTDNGSSWSNAVNINNWTSNAYPFDIKYGNSVWLVVGTNTVISTPSAIYSKSTDDGVSWTAQAVFPTWSNADGSIAYSIEYGNSTWIAVGFKMQLSTNNYATYSISSDDGASWTNAATLNGWFEAASSTNRAYSISFYNGTWIVVGTRSSGGNTYGGYSISTDNGSTWSAVATLTDFRVLNSIKCYNGVWVATGTSGITPVTSKYTISLDNGSTWSAATAITNWDGGIFGAQDVEYGDGSWIITGFDDDGTNKYGAYSISK